MEEGQTEARMKVEQEVEGEVNMTNGGDVGEKEEETMQESGEHMEMTQVDEVLVEFQVEEEVEVMEKVEESQVERE